MGTFSTIGTIGGGIVGGIYGGPAGAAAGAAAGGSIGGLLDPKKKVDDSANKAATAKANEFGKAVRTKREALETSPTEAPQAVLSRANRREVADVGSQGTTSADQQELQKALMARARGETASAAEMQLKQASDKAMAQQIAMARAQGTAAADRTAQRGIAQSQQQLASDAAILRAQEQAQAEKLAVDSAAVIRNQQMQDFDRALKADLANQGVDLDLLKLNTLQGSAQAELNLKAILESRGMDINQIDAYLRAEAASIGQALTAASDRASLQQKNLASERQALGGILSAAGTFAASQGGSGSGSAS